MNRNVTVEHLGEVPGQERHRLSPVAEKFLRQYGSLITVTNMGADLEPVDQDVDEGKDGHLWIPGAPKRASRIIVPVMVGFGEVKGAKDVAVQRG